MLPLSLFNDANTAAYVPHRFGAGDTPIVRDLRCKRRAPGAREFRAPYAQVVGNAPNADDRTSRLGHIPVAVPDRNQEAAIGNRAAVLGGIQAQ